jgi:hypothetical protein
MWFIHGYLRLVAAGLGLAEVLSWLHIATPMKKIAMTDQTMIGANTTAIVHFKTVQNPGIVNLRS